MKASLARLVTSLRIGWQLQRFELGLVVLLGGLATLLLAVEVIRLREVAPSAQCLLAYLRSGAESAGCISADAFLQRDNAEASRLMGVMGVLPFVLGAIPGSALVATEIEHRTAQLAWVLQPSRRRWVLERLVPVVVTLVVVGLSAGVAGEILSGARTPWLDASSSFADYGARGPVFLMRAVAIAAVAVFAGALVGRQLAGLVLAAALGYAVILILGSLRPFGEPLVPVPVNDPSQSNLRVAVFVPDPTAVALSDMRVFGIDGERLRSVELRESVLLLGVTIAATAATVIVVERRRPY